MKIKEIYGVYEEKYPNGICIGSGKLIFKEDGELDVSTIIEKALYEKCISCKVLILCIENQCDFYKERMIKYYGIDSLLNGKH